MGKIMFFAHDPGGANAISPLIEPLKKFHEVFVFAKGPALLKMPDPQEIQDDTFKKIMPDFLITGTSSNDMTEKYLWLEAKENNVKSMAILDHWMNYGIRFSKYKISEAEKFDKKCDFLPDFICVMDEFAKKETLNDGVPAEIIYPFGNPHFEALINQSKQVKNIKSQFAQEDEFLITFASESNIEDYGYGEEKNAVADLAEVLAGKNIKLVLRLHPKEDFSKYSEYENHPNIILDKNTPGMELIMASDLIVSMSSMFLIEAMILGKKVLSYQPNENNPDNFILTKKKALPFVNNKKDLQREADKIINSKECLNYNYDINLQAIEQIINFINGEL